MESSFRRFFLFCQIAILFRLCLNGPGLSLPKTAKTCLRIPVRFVWGHSLRQHRKEKFTKGTLKMSANTRQEKNKEMANLASLHAQAVSLIERSKRSPQQVHALLTSLQFFKENRLLASVPKPLKDTLPEPAEIQFLLSLRLSETHINRKTLAVLRGRGVEYVGELFVVNWSYSQIGNSVEEFLRSINLTLEFDFAEFDWTTPYADKNFLWRMNQPLALFVYQESDMVPWDRKTAEWMLGKFQYAGEFFQRLRRSWSNYRGPDLEHFHDVVRRDVKLRAGLYCPKSWTPPPDPPK